MKLRELLEAKGRVTVSTVSVAETMGVAVRRMVEMKIGALVVVAGGAPVGIVTERDVLRLAAERGTAFLDVPTEQAMTRDIVIGTYDDDIEQVEWLMTERRFRHLPVIEAGKLVGMVSIGDIVRARASSTATEIRYLRDYIAGEYH